MKKDELIKLRELRDMLNSYHTLKQFTEDVSNGNLAYVKADIQPIITEIHSRLRELTEKIYQKYGLIL